MLSATNGNHRSQKEMAYQDLRNKIIMLELKPGADISENWLSKVYSLSRTPIREILKRLQDEYLVEIIPQSGSKVTKIDTKLISETLFMRYCLEKEVVRLIAAAPNPQVIFSLKNNIDLQKFYYQRGMTVEFHQVDNDFHKLLYTHTNKPHIYDILCSVSAHYDRIRLLRILVEKSAKIEKYISDHEKILNIIAGEIAANEIDHVVSAHILEAESELLEQGKKLGLSAYFK